MKCPHCYLDAPDWHSYCLRCHRPIRPYSPHAGQAGPRRTLDRNRLWVTLSSWSLTAVFVVGSLVMIRLIDWGGLMALIHQEPPSLIASVEEERASQPSSRRNRRGDSRKSLLAAGENSSQGVPGEPAEAESVRAMSGRLEELPAPQAIDVANESGSGSRRPLPSLDESGVLIEQTDPPPTDSTGLLTISAYAPARIYIDGQYSGVTPRTVHLLAGDHQVRLVADGYVEWSSRVSVKKHQQMGMLASMTRSEP